jgi:hypothetical protein
MTYKLLCNNSPANLEGEVQRALENGASLWGAPLVYPGGFAQVVVYLEGSSKDRMIPAREG